MSGVDVLAVLDKYTAPELRLTRSAVAELIEAAATVVERGTDSPMHMRLEAALANVTGGAV